MFRTIHLMKRRPGMTVEAFRDYYETRHAMLGKAAADGHAIGYQRHYLDPMGPGDPPPVYDVMMQLCFPDRATFERCTGAVASDPARRDAFIEDELKLFDRDSVATFAAEDVSSTLPPVEPGDAPFRTVWFGRRRPDMTAAECRAYYETKHRLLGEYIMGGYARNYDRHYLQPLVPGQPEPDYTFIMEMDFPSRARFDEMTASIGGNPALAELLGQDEANYIDPAWSVRYAATLRVSELAPVEAYA
jgi:hypothetical protein